MYRAKLTRDLRARKVAPAIEQMLWHYATSQDEVDGQFVGVESVAQMRERLGQ